MFSVGVREGAIPNNLTVAIVQDEATDGSIVFRAEIPELPGCMSHGDTPEEAVQNLEEAFVLYMEVLAAQGRSLPVTTIGSTSGTALKTRIILAPSRLAVADSAIVTIRKEPIPS
jgi:predicted RNase H-like HicB family nuclease